MRTCRDSGCPEQVALSAWFQSKFASTLLLKGFVNRVEIICSAQVQ